MHLFISSEKFGHLTFSFNFAQNGVPFLSKLQLYIFSFTTYLKRRFLQPQGKYINFCCSKPIKGEKWVVVR